MITNTYQGKKILITGGCGFIGQSLVRALSGVNCTVMRMIRPGSIAPAVMGKFKIINLFHDLRKPFDWNKVVPGLDFIFHLAWQTSETIASQDPRTDFRVNVFPIVSLLKTCEVTGYKPTILFASSFTVIGLPKKIPIDESLTDNPLTIYDLHKTVVERYLHLYTQRCIIHSMTLRLSYVYGPGQRRNSARGVLNMMIYRALEGKNLTVYGSGNYLRDYIYIEDVVSAFLEAGRTVPKMDGQRPVIGTGIGHTIKEAFKMIALEGSKKTKKKITIIYPKPSPKLSVMDKCDFVANSSYFSKVSGWRAKVSLKEGIGRTMGFILNEKK